MKSKQNVYPENLWEALISALPNCTTMVLGMMTLNLWIYGHLTLENFIAALGPIYATAFCLDFFIVGPVVLRIVRRFDIMRYMPLVRVGLMAAILTCLAPVIETGYMPNAMQYIIALPRNYVTALLLQVLVAYPLGHAVLAKYKSVKAKLNVAR
ncbi:MAG: hypothetical protein E7011_01150 [Alphaproteobacteria bacterium]|nr:hypothetical protein [Alphaproteobacteria bacterium]